MWQTNNSGHINTIENNQPNASSVSRRDISIQLIFYLRKIIEIESLMVTTI